MQAPEASLNAGEPLAPPLEVRWQPALLDSSTDHAVAAWQRSLHGFVSRLPAHQAAAFVMAFDSATYYLHGSTAAAANGGCHPKHRLLNYHAFFCENITEGANVIDLGSGNGELALSIARRCAATVSGVEWNTHNLILAQSLASAHAPPHPLTFHHGDICTFRAGGTFDVIVLSNVLEHLANRVQLLTQWQEWYRPTTFLIRVPAVDRDWRVAWKQELEVEWRCDPTHETEYTPDTLAAELRSAGMSVQSIDRRWGELYCVARCPCAGGRP